MMHVMKSSTVTPLAMVALSCPNKKLIGVRSILGLLCLTSKTKLSFSNETWFWLLLVCRLIKSK